MSFLGLPLSLAFLLLTERERRREGSNASIRNFVPPAPSPSALCLLSAVPWRARAWRQRPCTWSGGCERRSLWKRKGRVEKLREGREFRRRLDWNLWRPPERGAKQKKKKNQPRPPLHASPPFPRCLSLFSFYSFLSLSLLALLPHRHLQSNPHGLSPNSTLKEEEEEEEEEEMKDSPPPRRGLAATTAAKTAPSLEPPTPACASPPSGGE